MTAPVIPEKYVAGYIVNADGDPEVGSVLTATLSHRIVNQVADYIMEIDEVVESTPTDGDGRFIFQLHPNNQPNDSPLNTSWTITEPSGHTETIFIPYNHPSGATGDTAIKYLSLITIPPDLEEPSTITELSGRVDYLEAALTGLAERDDVALDALDPPVPTDLLDAVSSASSLATSSTNGLLTSTDYSLIQTFKTGGTNDAAYLARLASPDSGTNKYLRLPVAADPTTTTSGQAWLWQSTSDLNAKVQRGNSSNRVQVSPGLNSLRFRVTTNQTFTTSTATDILEFALASSSEYEIYGQLAYQCPANVDFQVGFAGTAATSLLSWNYVGTAATMDTAGDEVRSLINTTRRTGTQTLTFGGAGATTPVGALIYGAVSTTSAGTLKLQGQKANAVAGTSVTLLAGSFINLRKTA